MLANGRMEGSTLRGNKGCDWHRGYMLQERDREKGGLMEGRGEGPPHVHAAITILLAISCTSNFRSPVTSASAHGFFTALALRGS